MDSALKDKLYDRGNDDDDYHDEDYGNPIYDNDDMNNSQLLSKSVNFSFDEITLAQNRKLNTISNSTDSPQKLFRCPTCSRGFIKTQYEKHLSICKTVFIRKRKPFNMKDVRCRIFNEQLKTTAEAFNSWAGGFKTTAKSSLSVEDMRAEKNPSHITCPVCNRNFNYESGLKHIKVCKESALRNKFKQNNATAEASKKPTIPRNLPVKPPINTSFITKNDVIAKKENIVPKPTMSSKNGINKRLNEQIPSSTSSQSLASNVPIRKPMMAFDRAPKPTTSIANSSLRNKPPARSVINQSINPTSAKSSKLSRHTDRSLTRATRGNKKA